LQQHLRMRLLLATNGSDAETLAALGGLLPQAEVVLAQPGGLGQPLELTLRNALPDREVVTVPIQVVVDAEEPTKPRAILGLRSVRTLIESGSLVICAIGRRPPVVIGSEGKMEAVETEVEAEPVLELLARRLDPSRVDPREVAGALGYARLP
jgi:carbamate kinase